MTIFLNGRVWIAQSLALLLSFANAPQSLQAAPPAVSPKEHNAERAVGASLYWLARHQSEDGSWSLVNYTKRCKDDTCTGAATQDSRCAATALGLLPFIAADQTHLRTGPFKNTVKRGIDWLVKLQAANGDLSSGGPTQMYAHGMATIVLCEAYIRSHDKELKEPAQRAIDFIKKSQDRTTGGWRYLPQQAGDTSVFGWQMIALQSAQAAGLTVQPATLDGAKKYLATVTKKDSKGTPIGQFSYMPDGAATPPMSAIGVLAGQYFQFQRTDPAIVSGESYLMANQPGKGTRNVYYWFYATQALHNLGGKDWTEWNSSLRDELVESQEHQGCALGSWNPDQSTRDVWGTAGGRLMTTSLSCLSLEVYYSYLSIFDTSKVFPVVKK